VKDTDHKRSKTNEASPVAPPVCCLERLSREGRAQEEPKVAKFAREKPEVKNSTQRSSEVC
jgi:hypothetical protein